MVKMEKPWLAHYPKAVPANIDVDQYKSLVEMLDLMILTQMVTMYP